MSLLKGYLYLSWPFFLIKPSNIQYSSDFYFVHFVIDWMSKNKYETNMISKCSCEPPVISNICQHLRSSRFFYGVRAHLSVFPVVFYLHLLVFVLCYIPVFPFSLNCPFLLMVTYKYIFKVMPYNYLGHIFSWLSYTFVHIILNDTYRYFNFDRLLKVLSSITVILLWSNRL